MDLDVSLWIFFVDVITWQEQIRTKFCVIAETAGFLSRQHIEYNTVNQENKHSFKTYKIISLVFFVVSFYCITCALHYVLLWTKDNNTTSYTNAEPFPQIICPCGACIGNPTGSQKGLSMGSICEGHLGLSNKTSTNPIRAHA